MLSMTGFGKAVCELSNKKINVEIRTLNSKQNDIFVRLPSFYRVKELEIRNLLSKSLERGKIDLSIHIENQQTEITNKINTSALRDYYQQVKECSIELGIEAPQNLSEFLRLPDVFFTETKELEEEEWSFILKTIEAAIENTKEFRAQEGRALKADLSERILLIQQYQQDIIPYEDERIHTIKQRINEALSQLPTEHIDKNRLEQEFIFYIEKLDINEEKVRLANHCKYFLEEMETDSTVGKKLGFIAQEIGREINTIGSKANHAQIQKIVIQMKDELEKIKEQVLNAL